MTERKADFLRNLIGQSTTVKVDNGRTLMRDGKGGIWLSNNPDYPIHLGYTKRDVDIDEKFIHVSGVVYDNDGKVVLKDETIEEMLNMGGCTVLNCKEYHIFIGSPARAGFITKFLSKGYYLVASHHTRPTEGLRILRVGTDFCEELGDIKNALYPVGSDHIVFDGRIIELKD